MNNAYTKQYQSVIEQIKTHIAQAKAVYPASRCLELSRNRLFLVIGTTGCTYYENVVNGDDLAKLQLAFEKVKQYVIPYPVTQAKEGHSQSFNQEVKHG